MHLMGKVKSKYSAGIVVSSIASNLYFLKGFSTENLSHFHVVVGTVRRRDG